MENGSEKSYSKEVRRMAKRAELSKEVYLNCLTLFTRFNSLGHDPEARCEVARAILMGYENQWKSFGNASSAEKGSAIVENYKLLKDAVHDSEKFFQVVKKMGRLDNFSSKRKLSLKDRSF